MAESHEDARSVARKEGVLVIRPERRYFNGMKANFEALEERLHLLAFQVAAAEDDVVACVRPASAQCAADIACTNDCNFHSVSLFLLELETTPLNRT